MIDPHRFYSPPEVWRQTNAARQQVYEALVKGELRAIRRGNRWRVSGAAVIAWIERVGEAR